MDKNQAKEIIEKLIEKYQIVLKSSLVKKYNEEETKKDFILPLFAALGWNVTNRTEVSAEESQSSGRVDYGFYLNGRAKFFLEAKSFKTDLNREEYAHQAIRYSWNKGITWAVLTDFESIKVFNADTASKYLSDKLFFEIPYTEFLERFDQLWLLSKEAFQEDQIDKEAERTGKKLQKISITNLLYKDLNECRDILIHDLSAWNEKVPKELLDEGVQKLLDRLVFIRVAEDREIEPHTLIPLIRNWENSKDRSKVPLYKSMISKFRDFDEIYNSNLFSPHPFEQWEDHSEATKRVVKILYGKEGYFEYDFKVIPADILGTVYENFLGYKLSQSKKGLTLDKDASKRKEQGIYYTPSFIVDFIVRNALKPVLGNCKSVNDLKKIKVLDPACGSGSFLIKALEVFLEKYKEFNYEASEYLKIQIITENLYGVDLDEQAVEIARLNLLLNALGQRDKLPPLDHNIKNGNSLVSGTDEELKKYFGKNFKDKKSFNWNEEFPEVFKQGGFNVIIGNPPYVTTKNELLSANEKSFLRETYSTAYDKFDLYTFFFERTINLLKNNGVLGFITPWNYLNNFYSFKLRKFILDNCKIIKITKTSPEVFQKVVVDTAISIFQKNNIDRERNSNKVIVEDIDGMGNKITEKIINQQQFLGNERNAFDIQVNDIPRKLYQGVARNSLPLGELVINYIGIMTGGNEQRISGTPKFKRSEKILTGKDISRYSLTYAEKYVDFDPKILHSNTNEKIFLTSPKILLRKTGDSLIATLDDNEFFTLQSLYNIVPKAKCDYSLKYLLAIINSKLQTFIYRSMFITNPKVFPYLKRKHLDQLPIYKIDFSNKVEKKKHDDIVNLVDKILDLKNEFKNTEENSNKWNALKLEVEKTDNKINEEVYRLYGLTPEEIEIVEKGNQ